jgi:hypothetical protein
MEAASEVIGAHQRVKNTLCHLVIAAVSGVYFPVSLPMDAGFTGHFRTSATNAAS